MTSDPKAIGRLDPIRKINDQPSLESSSTAPQNFGTFMQKAGEATASPPSLSATSPFDLPKTQLAPVTSPNLDTLLGQVRSSQGLLGDMSTALNTKDLKIKPSDRHLIKRKLTTANGYLHSVTTKMGLEPSRPPSTPQGEGIIGKLLNFISEGQGNLAAVQSQLLSMKNKGDSLQPADFLAIQLKLAHAQQEIEYGSLMLSKGVDAMKTLMNIQL